MSQNLIDEHALKLKESIENLRPNWDQYFMIIAKIVALRSTCNSRPGGAVIVSTDNRILATGYTASVAGSFQCIDRGLDFCYRRSIDTKDSAKYNDCKSIHAEQNAIIHAAKHGVSIMGSKIYCTLEPCYICLKLIAGSGITNIFFELEYESSNKERDGSWKSAFKEFGIMCEQIDISEYNKQLAINFIQNPTSYRRMKSE